MNICRCLFVAKLLCVCAAATGPSLTCSGCESESRTVNPIVRANVESQRHNQFAVRWILASDQSNLIGEALDQLKPVLADEVPGVSALRQMGMQIRRMPSQEGSIEQFVASLGPAAADVMTWHGAIHQWRSLLVVAIGPAPRAVAVGGQMMTLPAGVVSLDGRAWPLLTEGGDQLYLEMVPVFEGKAASQRASTSRKSKQTRVFESAEIRLMLGTDDVYVISSLETDQEQLGTVAGPVDPLDAHGKSQWTLGELLFTRDSPEHGRGLMILLPWGSDGLSE